MSSRRCRPLSLPIPSATLRPQNSENRAVFPPAAIFTHLQQHMKGAGSQQDSVDLTDGSGESCSQDVTSSSAQTNAPTAAAACNS